MLNYTMESSLCDESTWKMVTSSPPSQHRKPTISTDPSNGPKKQSITSLFTNAKSKLYNLYRPISKTVPILSETPLWCLGVCYPMTESLDFQNLGNENVAYKSNRGKGYTTTFNNCNEEYQIARTESKGFFSDFRSRIWFTYRNGMPVFDQTNLTSDMSWGCMLRTGQMMVAQALSVQYLGRDFRITDPTYQNDQNLKRQSYPESSYYIDSVYRNLIMWFADDHSAPYSIYNIRSTAERHLGKKAGEWFEPSTICHSLAGLLNQHNPGGVSAYVSSDSIVYISEITRLCTSHNLNYSQSHNDQTHPKQNKKQKANNQQTVWRPVIILMPVRLGLGKINPVYIPFIKSVLTWPQSIGVIGGKPNSSYWFVGWQDNQFFYLDPHVVQGWVNVNEENWGVESYVLEMPQMMAADLIDPSMAVGFYCDGKASFMDWVDRVKSLKEEYEIVIDVKEEREDYGSGGEEVGGDDGFVDM
eukprot:TRINITY_DN10650_c0_g1_i1.p1 TRINITY_DN10650_c0_g1~~TRINITY_DN10650_c0_g1_i1.p1  ORF type:complete len:472 (-),score=45.43 TRINITY_DN10650_c0_g1_i1:186-1601(-)